MSLCRDAFDVNEPNCAVSLHERDDGTLVAQVQPKG